MNPDRVLESFLEMVAIESPSWHEAPMAAYCAEKLAEMGFTVTFDASAAETGSDTGNLIAHLAGTVPGRIGFSAHLDTVKPCAGIEAVIEQRQPQPQQNGLPKEQQLRRYLDPHPPRSLRSQPPPPSEGSS